MKIITLITMVAILGIMGSMTLKAGENLINTHNYKLDMVYSVYSDVL